MKLDNKGFAASGILYTILLVFLAIIIGFMSILTSRKLILDNLKKEVIDESESLSSLDLWKTMAQKAGFDSGDYVSLADFMSSTTRVTTVFNDLDSTNYIIDHSTLYDEIKQLTNYEQGIVPIILASNTLTNQEKYDNNLPAYLVKNGVIQTSIIGTFTAYNSTDPIYNPNGYTTSTFNLACASSICTSTYYNNQTSPQDKSSKNLLGSTKIKLDDYRNIVLDLNSFNKTATSYEQKFGITDINTNQLTNYAIISTLTSSTKVSISIGSLTGEYYVGFSNGANNGTETTSFSNIYVD